MRYDEKIEFDPMSSSWRHMIYSLRYKQLDSIKSNCKEGLISSKTYYIIRNYYTIENKETSLSSKVESMKADPTIQVEKQWYEYTDWHDKHRAYLKNNGWQEKKRRALEIADYKCQLCSSKIRLHVHHNTYHRLGNEAASDLIILCEKCHRKHHNH